MADNNETYEFRVQANTAEAARSTEELKRLFKDVNETKARAEKNAGVVSENAILDQKRRYQELTKEVTKYAQALDRMRATGGNNDQVRQLQYLIRQMTGYTNAAGKEMIPNYMSQIATRMNMNAKMQSNNNSGYSSWRRENANSSKDFSGNRNFLNEYRAMTSDIKTLLRQQGSISTRTIARGHMTYTDQKQYAANRKYINEQSDSMYGEASNQRSRIDSDLRAQRANALKYKNANTPQELEELQKTKVKIDYLIKEKDAVEKFTETLDHARKSMGTLDSGLTNNKDRINIDEDPNSFRGKLRQRMFSLGYHANRAIIGGMSNMYNSGRSVYGEYGVQAMNLGSLLPSNGSDGGMLNRIQTQGARYGYQTKDSLAYYQLAASRSGNSNTFKFENDTDSLSESYMKNSRRSGLDENTYQDLMRSIAGANGVSNSKDIEKIVNQVLASNAMSGNSGNYQQNTQTLTAMISAISATQAMTKQDTRNLSVSQSSLSSLGKSWQGNSGANAMNNLNSAFTAASNGSNAGLQYLIMQQSGQGGLKGYVDAQKQASRGLGDLNNVSMLRDMVKGMSPESATLLLERNAGLTVNQADEFVKGANNNKLSDTELQKRLQAGNNSSKGNDNETKYDNSNTGRIKNNDAKHEQNATTIVNTFGKAVEDFKSAVERNAFTSAIGNIIGPAIGSVLSDVLGSFGGKFINDSLSKIGKKKIPDVLEDATKETLSPKHAKANIFARGWQALKTSKLGDFSSRGLDAAKNAKPLQWLSKGSEALKNSKAGNWISNGLSYFKSPVGKHTVEAAGEGSKLLGFGGKALKGLGKVAGKAAVPLAIAGSIFDVANSKNKGKAITRQAGGWGGAAAGMAAGAALGSVIPGAGNLVGGALGAIGGALGGFGGEWIGNKLGGKLFGKKSKKGSKGQATSDQATTGYQGYKEQEALLAQEKSITQDRLKYLKGMQALLSREGKSKIGSASVKIKNANGTLGLAAGIETEVNEGHKPEFIIPTDNAKRSRAQSLTNELYNATGLTATNTGKNGASVVKQGNYSPSVNIVVNGNPDSGTIKDIQSKVVNALNDATDNYRRSFSYGY